MSIIYNGQTVAGVYTEQILNNADTINAGIIKIATQEEVNAGENNTSAVTPLYLSNKQNKLESGDNISIENDIISCDIKPDVSTIIQNEDGTLTNIGQLTKSNTLKFDWEGTQAEYNVAYLNGAIQPDWYCYITDDEQFVDYDDVCNKSLSNLRPDGEARFDAKLNLNLDNINEEGEARFTAKADTDLSNLTEEGIKVIKDNSGSGLELCDIGMALYVDETKGLRRYLNGQIVDINTNTQAFLNRLLEIKNTNPDYFATEENWQSEALLNIDGCVYKFVLNYASDGETVVSVRLPKYPDYVEINAGGTLPVVGNGMTLGLTNGTVNGGLLADSTSKFLSYNGAYGSNVQNNLNGESTGTGLGFYGITTDPTKSGIQTTLKQTKLKMRYFIQIATGSETEANIVNTLENVNGFTLLESKYSDKPLYNECWLLSNNQWNPGGVYITAYEGLQVEHNTEIEAGTTVTLPSGVSYTKRGLSVKLSTETYTDYDFVLNTADETFRLPLKTNLASGKAVVGNGMTLGLTNGTQNGGLYQVLSNGIYLESSPTLYGSDIGTTGDNKTMSKHETLGITTDPTKSGMELSDSGLYLYFYVGDIDQNHGIVNMGRIGEQLATKTDMLQASGAGMPSSRYIDLTLGQSGSTYTAPANGWVYFARSNINGYTALLTYINNDKNNIKISTGQATTGGVSQCYIPVRKGDEFSAHYNGGEAYYFRFIYAEGSK